MLLGSFHCPYHYALRVVMLVVTLHVAKLTLDLLVRVAKARESTSTGACRACDSANTSIIGETRTMHSTSHCRSIEMSMGESTDKKKRQLTDL